MKFLKFKMPYKIEIGYKSKIVVIIIGSLVSISYLIFSQQIAEELKRKERIETKLWTRAITIQSNPRDINTPHNIKNLLKEIVNNESDKPIIITNKDLKFLDFKNVNPEIMVNPDLLRRELEDMANENEPITIEFMNGNFYYIFHKESPKLKMIRYMPYVQFATLIMLIVLISISYSSSKNNEQNKIWVGMAKETAHQLGTPSSSLLGWLEYLKSENLNPEAVAEIEKDISRLLKVVDRFSKIGSSANLDEKDVMKIVEKTVKYFQLRKPKRVTIELTNSENIAIMAMANDALLEWVMENTIKNAVDAVTGNGEIKVSVYRIGEKVIIDVKDNGKGINKSNFSKIFQPGFSTKTRGWGLGLSLCKRIMVDHGGKMYVVESKIDVGTTMRIELKAC